MSRDERLKSAIWRLNVTAHGPTEIDLGRKLLALLLSFLVILIVISPSPSLLDADFSDDHMIKVCPYLARNNILTDLNLSSNIFADDGARALARAIRKNTTLTKLDIRVGLT